MRALVRRCSGQHQMDVAYKVLGTMDIGTLGVTIKTEKVADVRRIGPPQGYHD